MIIRAQAVVCTMMFLFVAVSFAAPSGEHRLADAAKNQDRQTVVSLLKQHIDVNAPQGDGATALQWAAHWDDLGTTDLLIRSGANVNAANRLGVTPLSLACSNGSSAMVARLLQAGADAKAALRSGETALMTCVQGGSLESVKLLIERGAQVNAMGDQRGQTALMWAAADRRPERTKLLVDGGADVHAVSKGGFTALLFAAQSGDLESAKLLLAAGANVNEAVQDGTALLIASASGHEALAIFLLQRGGDPNAADPHGITPLFYAMQKGLSSIRSYNTTTQEGYAYFFRPNMLELVKALLAHGANPNARLEEKPRLYGPFMGSEAPNYLAGATPLLVAAASGDVAALHLLLQAGADPRVRSGGKPELNTQAGTNALMLAAGLGGSRRIHLTKETEQGYLDCVKVLVEETGADVNAADEAGWTPLHYAAWRGVDAVIQYLSDKGANIEAKDMYGQTPLSIAEFVHPPNITDKGKVPFDIRKSTAELLKRLGAKPVKFQPDLAQTMNAH